MVPVHRSVYLDHAGGAPVLEAVRAAIADLPEFNPSSPHAAGRAARAALDAARDTAAAALGVERRRVVFTASGTEAVNLAVLGAGRRLPAGRRVVTWESEHASVLGAVRRLALEGRPVTILPVDSSARPAALDLPADTGLVSICHANSEVGTVQPVAEVAAAAAATGAILHVDACASAPWLPPPVEHAALMSVSGHKLGAGRGGVLVADPGVPLEPLVFGGPQEWNRRAGREDVAGAVAVATALAASPFIPGAAPEPIRAALAAGGGRLTGAGQRLPNYATAAFAGRRGEDLLLLLDREGVAASSGSACASGSLDPSHVLLAMGLSMAEALGSLRLTVGPGTAAGDVEYAACVLERVLG